MRNKLAISLVALALLSGCTKTAIVGIVTDGDARIADVKILRTSGDATADNDAMVGARQVFATAVPHPLPNHKYAQRVNVDQTNAKPMARRDFDQMSAVLGESPTVRKMFEEKCRAEFGSKYEAEIKRDTGFGGPKGAAVWCARAISAIASKQISFEEFNNNVRGAKPSPKIAAILKGK